ncbi:sugar ABC transporter substrate-binding protein [Neobacillus sp. NPDC093127]|uniref:sugar ABC transporter substrate-binding protein n=1 Tax=Neobacillus sp. NPDC093127 TaxID=3364296 RepID=UPI00381DF207
MRKTSILILSCIFILLCYLTFLSAKKVFHSDWQLPLSIDQKQEQYRLVLITQDMETPFWDKVGHGARKQAKKDGISLEVWGIYGNNQEDFLKKIEIAIHSKVDGIIIQGLDTEAFKELTKIKASFYGIPIITVANDVPMAESLRRTYVGSDQYMAGKMIAQQLLTDMGSAGTVVLMYDSHQVYYQTERLRGIQNVLKDYPNVKIINAETTDTREQIMAATRDVLNRTPNVNAFIVVNANAAGAMAQEIRNRYQADHYHLYSFDDSPESLSLLKQGRLDAMIEQSPEKMGEISVERIMEWLNGDTVPLNIDGYFTDIKIVKANEVQ